MSLFLRRTNNLADVENINEARTNLGIGSLAQFNSNNVQITGGMIKADSFSLNSSNAKQGRFLICKSNGQIDFSDVNLGNWIYKDVCNINISEFDHSNFIFLNKQSLCNIAFTGDYNDILINKPVYYSDLSNDLDFLYNDLRNIDIDKARSNLGIGTLALKNTEDNIFFKNITITSNIRFENTTFDSNLPNKFLHIDTNGDAYWDILPLGSTDNFGVIKITNDFLSIANNTAPSMYAINDMHSTLLNRIEQIEAGNISEAINVVETINNNGVLMKENNLLELTNITHARSNLGFDSNMELLIQSINNSNTFSIEKLIITSNIIFDHGGGVTLNNLDSQLINNGTYLAVNSDGNVIPKNIPFATTSTPGFVYLIEEYDYTKFFISSQSTSTVISAQAFNQFINGVYIPLYNSISNSIVPRIRELYGNYLHISDNLLVDNPSIARQNLGLHDIAHTGDYFQLNNRPSNLSYFSNDSQFLVSHSNLADLTNVVIARSNLGIGSLASYDSNNVLFIKGNGSFSNINVSKNLSYKYDDLNHDNHFLKCINNNGDCRWEPLPEATNTKKGIVQLESDYTKFSDNKASSGAALYTIYNRLVGEIAILEREVNLLRSKVE